MSHIPDYYGEGGRLGSSPEDVLIHSAYKHDCSDANVLLPGMHKADLAHAMMLIEQKIIPVAKGKALLLGLLALEKIPAADFPIDPQYGDVYNSKDVALKKHIGDNAGWLHIGRARREAVNIGYLLATRKRLLAFANALSYLAKNLIHKAEISQDVLMPDFTYLHHAHPTQAGHYLLTFVYPILRDITRLKQVYQHVNCSPAGSGSVNGSSLPLDRERLKTLLCFDALSHHTRDAMWQVDVPIEAISAVVSTMTNLSRLAEELQIWNTAEFSMIDLPDSLCRASVIMPQKKNPYPLTYFRGLTASILGKMASFPVYGKIASGNPDSRIFIYGELPESLERSEEALILLAKVISDMEFNKALLLSRVKQDFSYATDLADYIVMQKRLNYRIAHQIVGALIRQLNEQNITAMSSIADLLNTIALKMADVNLDISERELISIIDPENIVASRKTIGGASEESMSTMLLECKQHLNEFDQWIENCQQNISYEALNNTLTQFLGVDV